STGETRDTRVVAPVGCSAGLGSAEQDRQQRTDHRKHSGLARFLRLPLVPIPRLRLAQGHPLPLPSPFSSSRRHNKSGLVHSSNRAGHPPGAWAGGGNSRGNRLDSNPHHLVTTVPERRAGDRDPTALTSTNIASRPARGTDAVPILADLDPDAGLVAAAA